MKESHAREIIAHVVENAIQLAFVRHDLGGDDPDTAVTASEVVKDIIDCLTGDDTGCLDPAELSSANCVRLWLEESY